jgi:beta-lactamase superfamily II metal-dependent hydrolase
LLDAIQPELVIITDSEFPATKRASAKLRERLERRGVPVIFTREAGAVEISLRKNRWEAFTTSGIRASRSPDSLK